MYLSDGYPQATAGNGSAPTARGVYLSDGYPQATAGFSLSPGVTQSVPERRLPAGHSNLYVAAKDRGVYLSDGYPQATAMTEYALHVLPVYLSDGYPQATAERRPQHHADKCT